MKSTQWLNEIRFASVSRLERWNLYRELMRWDKPVGFWLLAWPTLTALLIASQGQPSINNLIIFVVGIIAMRSAGCVLNDMADYKFDRKVKRTENRPLAIGALPLSEAAVLCAGLLFIAFVAVLFTNVTTIGLSFVAVVLASVYPFMKRFTYFPQVVLGAAFSWGIVMAFTAENMAVGPVAVLLFLGTWLWTISYDTMYALMDREDDVKIGVKSTAVLFGDLDQLFIAVLQIGVVAAYFLVGQITRMSWPYFVVILGMIFMFGLQQYWLKQGGAERWMRAFSSNMWLGALLWCGTGLSYLI